MVVLGLNQIPNSLSSTSYFNSRLDKSSFCSIDFIRYVVRMVIWCAWKCGHRFFATICKENVIFSKLLYRTSLPINIFMVK